MKTFNISLCAVLLFMLTTVAPSFGAEQVKVATFNIQQVIDNSKAGSDARRVIESKKSELQSKFKGDQESLKAQADEIEKKGSAWSEEVKSAKMLEFQKKKRAYDARLEDAQVEMQQLQKKVLDPIFKQLQAVISEIGKTGGYSLIFEKSRSNGLLYAADSLDISDKVTKALDAKMVNR